MGDDKANELQDPAEPKRVETVVETHDATEKTVTEAAADGDSGDSSDES